tara:strand:- start:700 stop:891 length:192 start_codon:yes stop_codon:yes gene_type:complete
MAFKMKGFTPFTKINDNDKKKKWVKMDFEPGKWRDGPINFMDKIPKGTVLTINYDKKGNIIKK